MSTYIYEPRRRISVAGDYDVIVAGGGPAGVAAAVSAARNRARTLIIEGTGCLGGMSTNGLLPSFCPYSAKREPLIRGLGYEVLERLRACDGVGDKKKTFRWVTIDAEKLKLVYDEMIRESRVDCLFFTSLSDVAVTGSRIRALITESKSGRQAFRGKTFVDCTGDADVAFRAGAPCVKGDPQGNLQATSLCFVLGGIDRKVFGPFYEKIGGQPGMRKILQTGRVDGRLKESRDTEFKISSSFYRSASGVMGFNFGHVYGVDGTDTRQLSAAMVKGRRLAHDYADFLRARVPGMRKVEIVNSAALLGVRETRRIVGDFVLEKDAFFDSLRFEDDIAVYDFAIDVHPPRKGKREAGVRNPYRELTAMAVKVAYGIPFRSLVPEKIRNLLVAGRSISADRSMQGSSRAMPACFATGEAAGTASAMAVRKGIPVGTVPVRALQTKLRKQGVYL